MAKINLRLYDEYAGEPYNMRHGKPRGFMLCGYCDQPYEPETYESQTHDGYGITMTVCSNCGEVCFPYEEE